VIQRIPPVCDVAADLEVEGVATIGRLRVAGLRVRLPPAEA